jgi:hypothetical protein
MSQRTPPGCRRVRVHFRGGLWCLKQSGQLSTYSWVVGRDAIWKTAFSIAFEIPKDDWAITQKLDEMACEIQKPPIDLLRQMAVAGATARQNADWNAETRVVQITHDLQEGWDIITR